MWQQRPLLCYRNGRNSKIKIKVFLFDFFQIVEQERARKRTDHTAQRPPTHAEHSP